MNRHIFHFILGGFYGLIVGITVSGLWISMTGDVVKIDIRYETETANESFLLCAFIVVCVTVMGLLAVVLLRRPASSIK